MRVRNLSVRVGGSARNMCRRRWWACESIQWGGEDKECQGSAEGVAAMASVTGPVPEVGAGPGPRVGGSDCAEIPQRSSWSHRHRIIISPGREAEQEAQMCVHLTSVHSKTSGHLFVFVCVRVCTPVPVCALLLCVCACLCLCMYLGLCLSVCGCWSLPVCRTVSGLCVAKCVCV